MRYKLDSNGYISSVAFGCSLGNCKEYTGTVPAGYSSLADWSENACINAYYIYGGNLVLDSSRLAECKQKEARDKVDYTPVVRKDLYESEEVLETQYIKATVTGKTINLTDAKVLPPRIKLTDVDPSAYSDIVLYVSNGTDTREYTILLDGLETVDYILIEKGLVIASVNGTEEVIGEGHVRLFDGVCNIYTSEVVTIEVEYSTNVQDVGSLEFLQGKATTSNKFKILEDGSVEMRGDTYITKLDDDGIICSRPDWGNRTKINPLGFYIYNESGERVGEFNYGSGGASISAMGLPSMFSTVWTKNLIVEESTVGANNNGTYHMLHDGTLICTKSVTFSRTFTNAWGSMYETTTNMQLGDWACPFVGVPHVTVSSTGAKDCFLETLHGVSETSAGYINACRPVNTTTPQDITITVIGVGRSK